MGGIAFEEDELLVEHPPNDLDELVIAFTGILDDLDVEHVYVSGYVAVLTGRSRATEDVDVLLERVDELGVEEAYERLERA